MPISSFSFSKVSRYAENPTFTEWKKVMNILKYLNFTKNYIITYKRQEEFEAYFFFFFFFISDLYHIWFQPPPHQGQWEY